MGVTVVEKNMSWPNTGITAARKALAW